MNEGMKERRGWAAAVGAVYRTRGGHEATIISYKVSLGCAETGKSAPVIVSIAIRIDDGDKNTQYQIDEQGNFMHVTHGEDAQFEEHASPGNHPFDLMTQIRGGSKYTGGV